MSFKVDKLGSNYTFKFGHTRIFPWLSLEQQFREYIVKMIQKLVIVGFLSLMTAAVSADTLLINNIEKNASVERPDRGMSRAQVESQFGKPVKKYSAIGEPPITKWSYANITVYFEHNHVIHSVVNRK